jgi:hypothetical protein
VRLAPLWVVLAFSFGCTKPTPEFPCGSGPPKPIALDVQLPVYVLGRWTVDSFSETLTLELARYNIAVVDRRSAPRIIALIDLGRWTYRSWQEIDVGLARAGETIPVGRVDVTDLSTSTLDVAAQSVALLIAKAIRTNEPAAKPSG